MVDFEPRAVKFALEFLQRAFEDIFTVKVLREWEALAEARTGETRLRQMYYLQQYIEKTLRAAAILYSGEPTITIEIIDHGKKALEKIYGLVFYYMRKKNVEPTSFPILDTIKSEKNGNYFHQIACWYSQAKYPCDSTVDKNIKKIQQSLKKHAEQTVISYANLPERYTTKYNSSSNVSNSNATEHQEQEAQKNTVDDMPEPDFHPKFAEAGSILGVVDADTYDKVCLFTNQFQEAFQKHIFKPLVKFLSSEKRNSLPEKDKKLIHFLSETSIVLDPKNVNTIPELDFNADIKDETENTENPEKSKKAESIEKLNQTLKKTRNINNPFDFSKILIPLDIIDYTDEQEQNTTPQAMKNNHTNPSDENPAEKENARRIAFAIGMCTAAENDLLTLRAISEWEGLSKIREGVMAKKTLLHFHQVAEKYAKTLSILNPEKQSGNFFIITHNINDLLPNGFLTQREKDALKELYRLFDVIKYPKNKYKNSNKNAVHYNEVSKFFSYDLETLGNLLNKIKSEIINKCAVYKFKNVFYDKMQSQFVNSIKKIDPSLTVNNIREDLVFVDKYKKQIDKNMLSWFKTSSALDKEKVDILFRR